MQFLFFTKFMIKNRTRVLSCKKHHYQPIKAGAYCSLLLARLFMPISQTRFLPINIHKSDKLFVHHYFEGWLAFIDPKKFLNKILAMIQPSFSIVTARQRLSELNKKFNRLSRWNWSSRIDPVMHNWSSRTDLVTRLSMTSSQVFVINARYHERT